MFKFVPFLMNHFVDFVEELKFYADTHYLKIILEKKPESERYYNIFDLIMILNNS